MSVNRPLGFFWDLENVQVPARCSALSIVSALRANMGHFGSEVEFVVVCDVRKEKPAIVNQLNSAQVCVLHVSAESKNAADEKLKSCLRKFAHTYKAPGTVVLISGDVNFAPNLSDLRFRFGFTVVLIHGPMVSAALLATASHGFEFRKMFRELVEFSPGFPNSPAQKSMLPSCSQQASAPVDIFATMDHFDVVGGDDDDISVLQSCELQVRNLPGHIEPFRIKERLRQISDNCGGRVLTVNPISRIALIKFPNTEATARAQKRMDGADAFGYRLNVIRKRRHTRSLSVEKRGRPTLSSNTTSGNPGRFRLSSSGKAQEARRVANLDFQSKSQLGFAGGGAAAESRRFQSLEVETQTVTQEQQRPSRGGFYAEHSFGDHSWSASPLEFGSWEKKTTATRTERTRIVENWSPGEEEFADSERESIEDERFPTEEKQLYGRTSRSEFHDTTHRTGEEVTEKVNFEDSRPPSDEDWCSGSAEELWINMDLNVLSVLEVLIAQPSLSVGLGQLGAAYAAYHGQPLLPSKFGCRSIRQIVYRCGNAVQLLERPSVPNKMPTIAKPNHFQQWYNTRKGANGNIVVDNSNNIKEMGGCAAITVNEGKSENGGGGEVAIATGKEVCALAASMMLDDQQQSTFGPLVLTLSDGRLRSVRAQQIYYIFIKRPDFEMSVGHFRHEMEVAFGCCVDIRTLLNAFPEIIELCKTVSYRHSVRLTAVQKFALRARLVLLSNGPPYLSVQALQRAYERRYGEKFEGKMYGYTTTLALIRAASHVLYTKGRGNVITVTINRNFLAALKPLKPDIIMPGDIIYQRNNMQRSPSAVTVGQQLQQLQQHNNRPTTFTPNNVVGSTGAPPPPVGTATPATAGRLSRTLYKNSEQEENEEGGSPSKRRGGSRYRAMSQHTGGRYTNRNQTPPNLPPRLRPKRQPTSTGKGAAVVATDETSNDGGRSKSVPPDEQRVSGGSSAGVGQRSSATKLRPLIATDADTRKQQMLEAQRGFWERERDIRDRGSNAKTGAPPKGGANMRGGGVLNKNKQLTETSSDDEEGEVDLVGHTGASSNEDNNQHGESGILIESDDEKPIGDRGAAPNASATSLSSKLDQIFAGACQIGQPLNQSVDSWLDSPLAYSSPVDTSILDESNTPTNSVLVGDRNYDDDYQLTSTASNSDLDPLIYTDDRGTGRKPLQLLPPSYFEQLNDQMGGEYTRCRRALGVQRNLLMTSLMTSGVVGSPAKDSGFGSTGQRSGDETDGNQPLLNDEKGKQHARVDAKNSTTRAMVSGVLTPVTSNDSKATSPSPSPSGTKGRRSRLAAKFEFSTQ